MLAEMTVGQKINLSETAFIERREDGYWNENNVMVVHTPGAIEASVERELFHPKAHQKIVEFVKSEAFLIEQDPIQFRRRGSHNVPFFVHLHQQLKDAASEIFGEPVKPSYVYLSLYNENGVCPFHTDRPQCKYTIDYCIDQDVEWPIWVDDKPYILQPNDALCYSGTDSPHWREMIKGKYCWLAFFHFVPEAFTGKLT
jgi:hypothetical protein